MKRSNANPKRRSTRIADRQNKLLCPLCELPSNDLMVACDRCERWHHHTCVGLTESIARALPSWHCNSCQSFMNPELHSMVNSMIFDPSGASSTMMAENNRTVISNPKVRETALTTNVTRGFVEQQRASLEKEIEETISKLQNTMKLVSKTNPHADKLPVTASSPIRLENSNLTIDNGLSKRMNLLREKERLIKMQIDVISEQLNQTHGTTKQDEFPKVVLPELTGRREVAPGCRSNAKAEFSYPPTRQLNNKAKSYERVTLDESEPQISVSQWMARQTVQPLPLFDGRPEDWQIFRSAFDRTTKLCQFSDDENLDRLQVSLKGVARDLVQGQFFLPKCVPRIMKDLEQAFGRPEQMMNVYLQKIRMTVSPHSDRPESIMQFASSVKNLWAMMESSNMKFHMNNPQMLQDLVGKLPMSLKYQWASHIINMSYYDVETFMDWLDKLVKKTTLVMPTISMFSNSDKPKQGRSDQSETRRRKDKERVHVQNVEAHVVVCKVCGGMCKGLANCKKFVGFNNDDKWKAIRDNGICKQCLKKHPFNRGFKCKAFVKCTVPNCIGRHHPLMHRDTVLQKDSNTENVVVSYTQRFNDSKPMLRYIPIILSNGETKVRDYAFLDEGSTGTMMESGLAEELKLDGIKSTLLVEYTANCRHSEPSLSIDGVTICGDFDDAKLVKLKNIQTVCQLGLERQTLDYIETSSQYKYLKRLPVQSYNDVRPRLLIGLNNWNCAVPCKVRFGENNDNPMAAKCVLGWSVFAGGSDKLKTRINYQVTENIEFDYMKDMVKQGMSIDGLGVNVPINEIASQEDRRAMEILKAETIKIGNRYQTALLWKHPEIKLPDNSKMALKRLYCLENQLSRQPKLAAAFREKLNENIKLGYVRKLTPEEIRQHHERIWYLPLLIVQNQNKPDHIRIVYDAAASSHGVSLNSVLMKGPDPINSLLGVLLRFRQPKIGVTGDIKHMFSQVIIRPQDQQVQRFFWRNEPSMEPDTYVLQVMSFGATCSPATAMYIKNVNAEAFKNEYPRAVKSIIDNHYVDDMLDGMDDENEAIQLAEQVKFIHSKAGFGIGKWKSNSAVVMKALGQEVNDDSRVNMNLEMSTEKVLGMFWDLQTDSFTYSLRFNKGVTEVLNGSRRPTKREILRILMSIFDPIGLIAHFLAYLKVLIQDVWKTGSNWDDKIDDKQNERWLKWVKMLPLLEDIRVPRCYLSSLEIWCDAEVQLHTLVDASIDCVAAVSYLRITRGCNTIVSLVGAKTKVAPLKPTSIPRLELTAALIGARWANTISEEINIQISRYVFWSDSKTVLCWLRSDAKRMKGQFVIFRISEIQDTTNVADWRYVPSRLNIADDATKWVGPPKICNDDRWFKGPSFLYEPEECWPKDKSLGYSTEEEMRREVVMTHNIIQPVIRFENFSNWRRLLRVFAHVFRYVNNLRAKINENVSTVNGYLKSEELVKAEKFIFQNIQLFAYPIEIKSLLSNNGVNEKSKLYPLSPILVDGVIRINGRTGAITNVEIPHFPEGHVSLNTVQPIILPPNHYGTCLLIQKYHEKYFHQHHETVVNEIRQLYHIPKLRQVLKKVIKSCAQCQILKAKPNPPRMADLPQGRLMPYTRPFTFVGVDCMGPIEVSVGRRREKRWICLFTCLTVRAIHLEILHHMDHDSFILIFRSFTQERGSPKEIYSDNGTNFVKAEKVLRENWLSIDMQAIAERFENPTMKWHFNPPSSPHMGGSWERLVKSVKNAFYSVRHHRPMNDQLLRSYIKEIQNVINSRPLTYLPLDSEEESALTPNHFLRGDSSGSHPIGVFNDDARILKWNWQTSQMYANKFWQRWIVEYMPELTRRSKWWGDVEPLKPGDVVLLVDPNLPRNLWPRGRIENTNVAKDGQVRSALVKTCTGFLTRPATKLAKLDCNSLCPDLRANSSGHRVENVGKQ